VPERNSNGCPRVTTLQNDVTYSLFGIFNIHLAVIYSEKTHNELWRRLLQETVARSGDITDCPWLGRKIIRVQRISPYTRLPHSRLPSLTKDEIRASVSSSRNAVTEELASKLYTLLDNMSAPRFANCRLHLLCIAFRVTEVSRKRGQAQETQVTSRQTGL